MDREKTVHFSIIKQKIIKTDEVLRMYLDTSNKLKKAQQAYKEIKLLYDQTVNNLSRIQLEHERCTFSIENIKHRNEILDKENKELQQQKCILEEKYNQQTVQSQLNIRNLEDELRMLNDVKSTTENWSQKKKRVTVNQSEKRDEIVGNKKSKTLTNKFMVDAAKETDCTNTEVKGIEEHHAFPYETINEAKETDSRLTQDIGIQTYGADAEKKNISVQTIETFKTLQLHDKIFKENHVLEQRILQCNAEIVKLQATKNLIKKDCFTQTDEEIENEFIQAILVEMSAPPLLSPLSPVSNENIDSFASPESAKVILTPPTPLLKTDVHQDIGSETLYGTNENTECSNEADVCTENKRFSRRCKQKFSNTKSSFVKLRKEWLRGLIRKRCILNKEIRKIKKLRRQDYLLKSLRALKQSKINFTISNDTILPRPNGIRDNMGLSYIRNNHSKNTFDSFFQKCEKRFLTEELNCMCKTCTRSNMLLSVVHGDTCLLGFYTVKNEANINTEISGRKENVWDTKSFAPMKLINSSLNDSNLTSEDILEILAEMVSKKLNGMEKNMPKRRRITTPHHSDTFCTETETELERLFHESKNDILKRNKMLLETAKRQNQRASVSASETVKMDYNNGGVLSDSGISFVDASAFKNADVLIPTEDSLNIIDEEINLDFELPVCPQLISPIKSVKQIKLPKCDHNEKQLQEETKICSLSDFNTYQNKFNRTDMPSKFFNHESEIFYGIKGNIEENTNLENYLSSSGVFSSDHDSSVITKQDKKEENIVAVPEEIKNVSHCASAQSNEKGKSKVSEEYSLCALSDNHEDVTNDECNNQNFENCPESPVPCNMPTEVKLPILIPLEKVSEQYMEEYKGKPDQHVNTFSPVRRANSKNNSLTSPSTKVVRRSKRISEKKRCSQTLDIIISNADTNNLSTVSCELLKTNSKYIQPLSSDISPTEQPRLEISNDITSDLNHQGIEISNKDLIEEKRCEKSIGTVSKTKKCASKLKSNVLRQIRIKRQMFRSAEGSILQPSKNKVELKDEELTVGGSKVTSKIRIVQNILIPANSDHVVDLMKENECKSSPVENCDIRLVSEKNSSQDCTAPLNTSSSRKTSGDCVEKAVPNKKKRLVHKKMDCDVLSKIIGEMDKDRPKVVLKPNERSSSLKNLVHDSVDEKQWRKGVLEIADKIHNTTSKENDLIGQDINNQAFNPKCKYTAKTKILLTRLLKRSIDEKIPDEIILECKRLDVNNIAEMILQKVSQDVHDKPDGKCYPAPLMTRTQRILLGLMVRLEQENVEKVMDMFLSKAEAFLFKIGCGIRTVIPITRLYMSVCKLRRDINRMRNFCCYAFLFMGDIAVPLYFTVLTSWIEVLPMEANIESYPLAKVLIHVVNLKTCNKPGYNLLPLKLLFNQFYGYPKERWNCDEIFDNFFQQYLKNPDKSSDIALRLLCKNKDSKWVHKKINENFKPLIYKIPLENVNFKATVIILIGNISRNFKPKNEFDETSLKELRRWLISLTEDENVPDLVARSVDWSLSRLPKRKMPKAKKTKCKPNPKTNVKQKKKKNKKKCKKKITSIVK